MLRWSLPAGTLTGVPSWKWLSARPKRSRDCPASHRTGAAGPLIGIFEPCGLFLVDDGRELLRKLVRYRWSPVGWLRETIIRHAASAYLLGVELGAFVLTACLLLACGRTISMAILLPLLLVPATGAAIDVINQLIALFFPPRVLPNWICRKAFPMSA